MQKILIIRSCHMMQFSAACEFLKNKYPDSSITAVVQASSVDAVDSIGYIDKIISVQESSPWSVNSLNNEERKTLGEEHYDLVVVPYNNHSGVRYRNVEKFVSVVQTDNVMMYMTDGKINLFSVFKWRVELIRKSIWTILDKVLFVSFSLLFFLIWLACYFLKPFFRIRNKDITFFSPQNFNYPSARIRCYDFARILQKSGNNVDVVGYDNLLKLRGDHDPIPEEMSDFRKLWVNIALFFKLFFSNKSSIFVLQKVKYNALAPYFVALIKNITIVVDMDDDEFTSPVFNFLPAAKLFSYICRTKNVIGIAASNRLCERMSEYVDTVFYIPTVVDRKRFYPLVDKKPQDEVVFCWSGIVFGPPVFENIEFVLEAFRRVYAVNKNVKLKIAVRGPLLKLLEIKINNLYADIPLEMIEWIAPDKMRDFYVSSDVGLNPLVRNDEFTLCKSPTKLFEYMACGLPSVTHRIGEATFIVNNGEDGFLADDIDDFVKKMLLLADDKTLRTKMGQKAYNTINDRYCLEAVDGKLNEVFLAADAIHD